MRRRLRDLAFRLVRSDIIQFIEDHEGEMQVIFREEMYKLDRQIPEENLYIDIKIVELGEEILVAALETIKRIMREL